MEITKESLEKTVMMLDEAKSNDENEVECVYNSVSITKEMFDRVKNYLEKSSDYEVMKENTNKNTLDITLLDTDYRITVSDSHSINEVCKTDVLHFFEIMEKAKVDAFEPIKHKDYDFTIKIKKESERKPEDIQNFKEMYTDAYKHYRYKQRYSFLDSEKIFRVDITIVKQSSNVSKSLKGSGVLSSLEKYEIEIEYLNKSETKYKTSEIAERFYSNIGKIKQVMEDTEYLISKEKQLFVLHQYLNLVNPTMFDDPQSDGLQYIKRVVLKRPKEHMLSYQPITLEQMNVVEEALGRKSILSNYTVTEKADGERYLLFVDDKHEMFSIDSRLTVKKLGVKHKHKNILVDAEYVIKSKFNTLLETYYCFDIYFNDGVDVRDKPLIPDRVDLMESFVKHVPKGLQIHVKKFLQDNDIFKACAKVYNKSKYDYNIDGLIFTPSNLAVGSVYNKEPAVKNTFGGPWMNVFKWKPPEENSIDFLVRYDRTIMLKNVGKCVLCQLQVSMRAYSDEFIDPYMILSSNGFYEKARMAPKTFVEVYFKIPDNGKYPITMDNEIILDNTIVECIYDGEESELFCWIPYRLRVDKTQIYKRSGNIANTANAYMTALNVWRSIQNPVTTELITGKEKITVSDINENNVYYSRNISRDKILSKPMLTFHNVGVKSKLFGLFKNQNYSLCDLASGKAGDLNKWLENRFTHVVGIDNNIDNILNNVDGAYRRLTKLKTTTTQARNTQVVFLQKDLKTNWEDTSSIENAQMMELYNVMWGNIFKNDVSNPSILKYYNLLNKKFDVVSCQFAIHYMFENEEILDTFCSNLDRITKKEGYFIGTCLDGELVDKMLGKTKDGLKEGNFNDNILWMIQKKYNNNFQKKTGQSINVYLESINVVHEEYLVNFDLLIEKLEEKGFKQLSTNDLKKFNLKSSIGNFEELHGDDEYPMIDVLKDFSFLNKWFIFKKY
jgi:hypothetical protein